MNIQGNTSVQAQDTSKRQAYGTGQTGQDCIGQWQRGEAETERDL
jgi:hypothetical protein